ncbi:efflux RND transporter periplasmic adaptor subunit [Niastella vici]|nr:efflux RND transporter periplasmic adaptor subunit [Niastella vici]
MLLVMASAACRQGEQKHIGHQPGSDTGMKSGMQHDSMSDMNNTAKETNWHALPTNRTVIARQKVIAPVYSDMNFNIPGNGYIAFDTRRNRKVSVRVGGRIDRLYVKYNYQYVRKGEKILELYSPELNTYIEEYLYVLRQTNDTILQNRARQKLQLLGLTPVQLQHIDQTGSASLTIPLYSPFEGYVLFNPSASSGMGTAGNASGSMGSGGMSGTSNSSPSIQGSVLSDNSIREGMYVSNNQTLFWINDFKQAWGIIAFTKENEKYIRKGQPIVITSELLPDRPIQTSIQLIEQVYEGEQKFTQARVYIPNATGIMKQNSLITATVSVPARSLVVPAVSVYYLGKVAIVWVQVGTTKEGNAVFQSRVVKIGHRGNDKVEILEGLAQNEKIARDAGYLADGETIIQY